MIIRDSNKIKKKIITSDLSIIGSGISGIFLAYLLRNQNLKICLIEKGNTKFKKKEHLYINKNIFHSGAFKEEGIKIGGKGNIWGGQLVEFSEQDLKKNNWGLSYPELKKLYKKVYQILKIKISRNPNNINSKLIFENFKIKRYFSYFLKTPSLYDYFYKELKNHENIEIYKNLSAVKLNFRGKYAENIECNNSNNDKILIKAKKFIFSMGTLENNRFFLNNQILKNTPISKNKNIGKYFQDHLGIIIGKLKINSETKFRDYFENGIYNGITYQPKIKSIDKKQPIGISAEFHYKSKNDARIFQLKKNIKNIRHNFSVKLFLDIFKDFKNIKILFEIFFHYLSKKRIKSFFDQKIDVYVQSEQIPISKSYLELSRSRSKDNNYKLNVYWDITNKELESIRVFSRNLFQFLKKKKIGKIIFNESLYNKKNFVKRLRDTNHPSGGLCIGNFNKGVCNKNMQLYNTKNVFIAGSSIFPNSSYANTGLTILAMTLKLANYLKKIN